MDNVAEYLSLTHVRTLENTFKMIGKLNGRIQAFQKQIYKRETGVENQREELQKMKEIAKKLKEGGYNKIDRTNTKYINEMQTAKTHWETIGGYNEEKEAKTPYEKPKYIYDELQKVLMQNLDEMKKKARKTELITRLRWEMREKQEKRWYMIFNTLTVAPENYTKIFKVGSKEFQKYIQKINTRAGGKQKHKYFAVIEAGAEKGRLHIHIIHMMQEIPDTWTDPNRAKIIPNARQMTQLIPLWTHGFSTPIIVRFDPADAWATKKNHRWPVKKDEQGINKPIESSNGEKLAFYLGKYLTKILHKTKGDYKWKTRMTQGIGMKLIKETMKKSTDGELLTMCQTPTNKTYMLEEQRIPRNLIIKEANREILKRMPGNQKIKTLMEIQPANSIIKQYKNLIQIPRTYNSANTSHSVIRKSKNTEISRTNEILWEEANKLFKTNKTIGHKLAGPTNARN